MHLSRQTGTVITLGVTQTLAWASSYYLIAVLAGPMAHDLGVDPPAVFALFSVALLVSAALGPQSGKVIDRLGGRWVLVGSNLIFAVGLVLLAWAPSFLWLGLAWAVMGLGMGCGLYESAFGTVVRLYGKDSRTSITGITLFAGFASTVGWPLTTWLELHWGWRGAALAWAALHVFLALPMNVSLPTAPASVPKPSTPQVGEVAQDTDPGTERRKAYLLAYVFAVTWFISTSMAAHLPTVLVAAGTTLAGAIAMGSLIGPAQVAGRLLEFGFLRRAGPLLAARLAATGHPLGVLLLLVLGPQVAAAFVVLHGLGNGILTIAIGTLPLVLFGAEGYARRQGLLMVPARVIQAAAPFLFGWAVQWWGMFSLLLTAGLAASACVALGMLNRNKAP